MAQPQLCGTRPPFQALPAAPTYGGAMRPKSELERLTEAVRKAEAELDAATTRSALNSAAKRLMMARAALKRLQDEPATHRVASRGVAQAGAS